MRVLTLIVLFCVLLPLSSAGCAKSGESPDVQLERARILSDRGQFEEAVAMFSKVLESMPDRSDVYYSRGVAYENAGLPEKALPDYTRCLELEPTRTEAINNRGVVLARLERYEEAVAEFTRLVNLQPDDALALRNRGLSRHDLGQLDEAIADYTLALQIAPNDAQNWFQRGNVYLDQKQPELAIQDFSSAIERDPKLARAWMNRGVARYQLGEKSAAAEDLKHAQELDDNIILPGIDFFADAASGGLVPAETRAPSVQIVADTTGWKESLAVVLAELEGRGFDQISVTSEVPDRQCAVVRAEMMGVERTVFVGCRRLAVSGKDDSRVVLPGELSVFLGAAAERAVAGDIAGFPVLVIVRPSADGQSAPTIESFDDEWQPDAARAKMLLIEVEL